MTLTKDYVKMIQPIWSEGSWVLKIFSHIARTWESQHWDTATKYIMAAWEVVTMTPVWEESVHNNTWNTCCRLLAQAVMCSFFSLLYTKNITLLNYTIQFNFTD